MTEIAFHFNAPSKLAYACKLLRKASASGARVAVVGPAELLGRLDVELWTFSALDFVAHCKAPASAKALATDAAANALVTAGDAAAESTARALLAASPIVLCEAAADSPHSQVLVNLGQGVPAGFERFERIIEVVTHDEADRQAARPRWKHYADRGYAIVRHDLLVAP